MIRGFGGGSRNDAFIHSRHVGGGNLPIPFNIPNVLYNLLFEDLGLEFTRKQQDMIDAVSFSYKAVGRMEQKYAQEEQELMQKMIKSSDDKSLKSSLEELHINRFQANQHFKELVIVLSELLDKDQYGKLMSFSGIPV